MAEAQKTKGRGRAKAPAAPEVQDAAPEVQDTEENANQGMSFCEAMEAARKGARLRRRKWGERILPGGAVVIRRGETLPTVAYETYYAVFTVSTEDAMANDWYEVKGDDNA
ncbi:Thoeris anti-defense Tad2 family protein [Nitratifractor sp.]